MNTTTCTSCKERLAFRRGLCSPCYDRELRPRGVCPQCGKEDQLRAGICTSCYRKKMRYKSKKPCSKCGDEVARQYEGVCIPCRKIRPPKQVCSICGDEHWGLGLCRKHWSAVWRRRRGIPERPAQPDHCAERGCDAAGPYRKGRCHRHYQQVVRRSLGVQPRVPKAEREPLPRKLVVVEGPSTQVVHWVPTDVEGWVCPDCGVVAS